LTLSELARAAQLPKSDGAPSARPPHRTRRRRAPRRRLQAQPRAHAAGSDHSGRQHARTLRSPTWPACTAGPARPCISASCGSSTSSTSRSSALQLNRLCCPGSVAGCPPTAPRSARPWLAWEDLDDLAAFLPSPMPKLTPGFGEQCRQPDRRAARRSRDMGSPGERNEAQPGCPASPLRLWCGALRSRRCPSA